MAIDGAAEQQGASPATEEGRTEDLEAHKRDYSGFVRMFKWLAIIAFVTAIFVMIIIS